MHRVNAWVRLGSGQIYFVAACGTTGYVDAVPVGISDEDDRCVMCFFEVAERSA